MRFVDVAAGSGALGIPAARIGAKVLAIDQSPVMLELLTERATKLGLRIEAREMDGHTLELADDSFDMAGPLFGVMLFPGMPKGIREMARVVRPGGRVVVIAYGDPRQIDFLTFLVQALWDWIVWSNPIVEEVLECPQLSRDVVRRTLDALVRDRAGAAVLTNPGNIGIGTK